MSIHFRSTGPLVMILFLAWTGQPVRGQQADSLVKIIEDVGQFLLYRNHDTNYITNYGNELSMRLVAVNKFNYFRLHDLDNKSHLRYRPLRDVSLGLGASFHYFALDITFSLGLRNKSDFENTRSFDFQGRLYSSKQFLSATMQYYQGYQLGEGTSLMVNLSETSGRREDIRTINFGLQYLYAWNYTRFSMKAPFVFNEIQLKSAGSPILGFSFGIFTMNADSSVIPPELAPDFASGLYISDMSILMGAASLGYMYTFVYHRHYFITLSIIPGICINSGDFFNEQRQYIPLNAHIKINTMNAIGYSGRRFYTGINFNSDFYFSRLARKQLAEVGYGRFTLLVGYRFKRKNTTDGA